MLQGWLQATWSVLTHLDAEVWFHLLSFSIYFSFFNPNENKTFGPRHLGTEVRKHRPVACNQPCNLFLSTSHSLIQMREDETKPRH
jgi:hypothetical protein